MPGTAAALGHVRGLSAGVVAGVKRIIAAGAAGIASTPVAADSSGSHWSVAPYPPPLDPEFKDSNGNRFTASIDPRTGNTGKGCYFLVFVPTIREMRDFYREM
eukprot:SAG31_NODE_1584_length_7827_cov_2.129788_10_plen_103_part_00